MDFACVRDMACLMRFFFVYVWAVSTEHVYVSFCVYSMTMCGLMWSTKQLARGKKMGDIHIKFIIYLRVYKIIVSHITYYFDCHNITNPINRFFVYSILVDHVVYFCPSLSFLFHQLSSYECENQLNRIEMNPDSLPSEKYPCINLCFTREHVFNS